MKRTTHFINKKSRLIQPPAVNKGIGSRLTPFNQSGLRERLPKLLKVQNDYFPCFDWTFPPPLLSKSSPPECASELFSKPSVIPDRYSIYLHSPFCKSLCNFCYYSVIPGKGIEIAETYVDYLIKEMALYANTLEDQVCESIYFGGGTPTLLDDELLERIFFRLNHYFNIAEQAEISIESSPGTLSRQKSALLKEIGVNRLSYGIQTLDEKLLYEMNREYSVDQAIEELEGAIDIIGNVNVDTMYGFEGEQEGTLVDTLKHFYAIGVPSFSIYALDKQRSKGINNFAPPKDDYYHKKIAQFAQAENFLMDLGYKPVLQNIFIDPERASYVHQLRRWDNLSLVAMGLNAQGYAPQNSYQNVGSLKSYYKLIDKGALPIVTVDELDPELELCRELTSKLRFTFVSLSEIKYKYGVEIARIFEHLIKSLAELGYVECAGDILRMTNKAAYYNNVIPMLFASDDFKEQLMGLPEEYIEVFPVPYIMTKLGRAQSAPFDLADDRNRINTDRRSIIDRRIKRKANIADERRKNIGRRNRDGIWNWSAIRNKPNESDYTNPGP